MATAIISDTTGKTVSRDVSYQVDVYSRSTKTHLKFDTEMNEQLKNLMALAIQNGVSHTTWSKEAKQFVEVEVKETQKVIA